MYIIKLGTVRGKPTLTGFEDFLGSCHRSITSLGIPS
jgi:hypothetical protein